MENIKEWVDLAYLVEKQVREQYEEVQSRLKEIDASFQIDPPKIVGPFRGIVFWVRVNHNPHSKILWVADFKENSKVDLEAIVIEFLEEIMITSALSPAEKMHLSAL